MEIDLRHLQHAQLLAEHRSFVKTSKALGITQPTLSRSIQQLERRLGVLLFSRRREAVEPTEMGRLLLGRANHVLSEASELLREMQLIRGMEVAEVRVGAGVYPSEIFVADAVASMIRKQPGLKIRIFANIASTLISALRRKELDLAVIDPKWAEGSDDLHLTLLSWHRGTAVVRAGHPLLSHKQCSLGDLLCYPLAFTSQIPPDLLSMFTTEFAKVPAKQRRAGAVPTIGCESTSMMRTIVARSDAVAFLTLSVVADDIANRRLAALPFTAPWLGRAFAVARLTNRDVSPAAAALVRELVESDRAAVLQEEELAAPSRRHDMRRQRSVVGRRR